MMTWHYDYEAYKWPGTHGKERRRGNQSHALWITADLTVASRTTLANEVTLLRRRVVTMLVHKTPIS